MSHPFSFKVEGNMVSLMCDDKVLQRCVIAPSIEEAKRVLAFWLEDRAHKLAKELGVARP